MRNKIFTLSICFFLLQAVSFTANAQCNVDLSAVSTPTSCYNDGTITVTVSGSDLANIRLSDAQFELKVVGAEGQPTSPAVWESVPAGNLNSPTKIFRQAVKGSYELEMEAFCQSSPGNWTTVKVSTRVTVGGTYDPLVLGAGMSRKSLSCKNTGQVRYTFSSGKAPHNVTVTAPAGYPGQLSFSSSGAAVTVDNVPPGSYTVTATDACGYIATKTFTVTTLTNDVPQTLYAAMRRYATGSACNTIYPYQTPTDPADADELFYWTNSATYYEYAYSVGSTPPASGSSDWAPLPAGKLPTFVFPSTYSNYAAFCASGNTVYSHIRPTGCTTPRSLQHTLSSYVCPSVTTTITANIVTDEANCSKAKLSIVIDSQYGVCYPATWTVAATATPGTIIDSGTFTSNGTQSSTALYDRGTAYTITVTDASNKVFTRAWTPTSSTGQSFMSSQFTGDYNCENGVRPIGAVSRIIGVSPNWGAILPNTQIEYVSGPGPIGMGPVGTVYTVPAGNTGYYFHFNEPGGLVSSGSAYRWLTPGSYVFKITNTCGTEQTITITHSSCFTTPQPLTFDTKRECGGLKITPQGLVQRMNSGGAIVTATTYYRIMEAPTGAAYDNSVISPGGSFVLTTPGTYKIGMLTVNNSTECAIGSATFVYPSQGLYIDPELTASYVCEGKTDGTIRVKAINGVAPYIYTITSAPGTDPITAQTNTDITGDGALFSAIGKAGGTYNINVKDACNNEFNIPVTMIDLVNANIVYTVNNGIFCDRAEIEINCVALGQTSYEWRKLPDTEPFSYAQRPRPIANFPGSAGTYQVTVIPEGCAAPMTRSLEIDILPGPPTLSVPTPNIVACQNSGNVNIVTLSGVTASSSCTLKWYDGDQNPIAAPTSHPTTSITTTTFYVSQTLNSTSCEGERKQITVRVLQPGECVCPVDPTVSFGTTTSSICGTTAVQSTVTFGGSATLVTLTITNGSGSLSTTNPSSGASVTYTPVAGDAGKTVTITATTDHPGAPCQSAIDTWNITVNSIPSVPVGTATQAKCLGNTLNDLTVSGSNIKWYDASTGGNLLSNTTPLVNNTTYYASQTVNGCESARTSITVTSSTSAPTGSTSQAMCTGSTVADLAAKLTGAGIKIYTEATGGSALTTETLTARTYYASQTVSSCESFGRLAVTVTITPTPSATISYAGSPYPAGVSTPQPVTRTGTAGGTYSAAPSGLSINTSTGTVTPSLSTPGSYTVTYTIATAGGCAEFTTTAPVVIQVQPGGCELLYSGSATQSYCKSQTTPQTPAPMGTFCVGGAFSATPSGLTLNTSTGAITPSSSTAGTYTVSYTISGIEAGTATVTITPTPSATISYAGSPYPAGVSSPQSVTFSGTTGGTYSATPSGLDINTSTGAVTPISSTPNSYTVTYRIAEAGGCAEYTTTASVVIQIPCTGCCNFSYADPAYCTSETAAKTPSAMGASCVGGTFSATPSGLTLNTSTGAITPSSSTPNTYTVSYTVAGTVINTTTVTITATPSATISYAGSPYPAGVSASQPITRTGTAGGTYTATPSGLELNSSTGAVIPNLSLVGTYTVKYTIAEAGGCAAFETTASVEIKIPTCDLLYSGSSNQAYCRSVNTPQTPDAMSASCVGGTFSATPSGLMLVASTGAITPNSSTAGVYTVSYTVAGTVISTATVTITAIPSATISYAGSPYPAGDPASKSVTFSGTAGGTYSAEPSGLTLVSTGSGAGSVTPSSSTAGTYTVTYTIAAAGGCAEFTTTASVVIRIPPPGECDLLYSGSATNAAYCKSETAAQNPASMGTTCIGGVFSATPSGLTLNTSTGAITPSSSTAGVYTVSYTISGTVVASATVTITATPSATISYAGTPYPVGFSTPQAVTFSGTEGGTYSASPSGLYIDASTGAVTPSTSTIGSYTVTYTITAAGGCAEFTTTTPVVIRSIPPGECDLLYSGSSTRAYCMSETNPQTPASMGATCVGGTFSATPSGLTLDPSTGAIMPSSSISGTYAVSYTIIGTVVASATVVITTTPSATISYDGSPYPAGVSAPQSVTFSGTTGGAYTATPSGLTLDPSTGAITPSSSTQGSYTVTYTIAEAGGCAEYTTTAPVVIYIPDCELLYSGFNTQAYCKSETADQSPASMAASCVGGTFSATPSGLTLNTTTGAITPSSSTAGVYTVSYTISGSVVASATVTITAIPSATISYAGSPYPAGDPASKSVTFSGTEGGAYTATPSGLTLTTTTGAITPSSSTAGTYTVTYTIAEAGGCAEFTTTASVVIRIPPPGECDLLYSGSATNAAYCRSETADQTPASMGTTCVGGTFSATPSGLTLNTSTGAITPSSSTADVYTVSYTISGTVVATATVTITAIPSATISYAGSPYPAGISTPQSVTFSGTEGGAYTATPNNESYTLRIDASTGAVTPSQSKPGSYTVTYTIAEAGGCAEFTTTAPVVIKVPDPGECDLLYSGSATNAAYCKSETAAQTPASMATSCIGGTFSATPSGLTLDPSTGAITPSSSDADIYTVSYTISGNVVGTATVTITAIPLATINYAGSPYPAGESTPQSVTFSGTEGGTFSATPTGLTLNTSTGAVTPSSSTPSLTPYTVTYLIAEAGGCAEFSTTAQVIIRRPPVGECILSYSGSEEQAAFCKKETAAQTPASMGSTCVGGTFSAAPSGLTLDTSTGAITPSSSDAGTYTVSYTISGTVVAETTVTIYPTFNAGAIATDESAVCSSDVSTIQIDNTTTASGGHGTITYEWYKNDVAIPSSNSVTYDIPEDDRINTSNSDATIVYTRKAKDATCEQAFVESLGSYTLTVYASFKPGVITADNPFVCSDDVSDMQIGSVTDAANGHGEITYEWYKNDVAIANSNNATYDIPTDDRINEGISNVVIKYTRKAKDTTCQTTFTGSTGVYTLTVYPSFKPGAIKADSVMVCSGDDATRNIGSSIAASGGYGTITYEWYKNGVAIPNSNDAGYTIPEEDKVAATSATITYTRKAKDATCQTTFVDSKGEYKLTVNPHSTAGMLVTTPDTTICSGSPLELIASAPSVVNPEYRWYIGATTPNPIGREPRYIPSEEETKSLAHTTNIYYVAVSGSNYCEGSNIAGRKPISVTIKPNISSDMLIVRDTTICSGESVELCVDLPAVVTNPVYKWYRSATGTEENVPTHLIGIGRCFIHPSDLGSVAGATPYVYYVTALGDNYCEGSNSLDGRKPVIVTVKAISGPKDITMSGITGVCGAEGTTLEANAPNVLNPVFKWYSNPEGGEPFYTGHQYKTSALKADTTFYLSVSGSNYCEGSIRDTVEVTMACFTVHGTVFPLVFIGDDEIDALFTIQARLYAPPPPGVGDPIAYLRRIRPLHDTTAVRYNGSVHVPGTPRNPGYSGSLLNPGAPINWEIINKIPDPGIEKDTTTVLPGETSLVGHYTFKNVAPGNYILTLSRPGYITRYAKVTVVSGSAPFFEHRELIGGDVNNSSSIDVLDINAINYRLGYSFGDVGYDAQYDINGNTEIEIGDISLVKSFQGFHIQGYIDTNDWLEEYYGE